MSACKTMLRRLIGEDVELSTSVRTGCLPKVLVDPGQVEQVIMNLAVNARDAMPRGGMLTLETVGRWCSTRPTPRSTWASTPGPHVMLAVSDTGCGYGQGDPNADVRAVLHHQGTRQGHRARAGDGLRRGAAERRNHLGVQRAGKGDDVQGVLPAGAEGRTAASPAVQPTPLAGSERASDGGSETMLAGGGRGRRARARADDPEASRATPCSRRPTAQHALELSPRKHPERIDLLVTDVVMPRMGGTRAGGDAAAAAPGHAEGAVHVGLHRRRGGAARDPRLRRSPSCRSRSHRKPFARKVREVAEPSSANVGVYGATSRPVDRDAACARPWQDVSGRHVARHAPAAHGLRRRRPLSPELRSPVVAADAASRGGAQRSHAPCRRAERSGERASPTAISARAPATRCSPSRRPHPQGRFYGVDFHPEQIAAAKARRAERARSRQRRRWWNVTSAICSRRRTSLRSTSSSPTGSGPG